MLLIVSVLTVCFFAVSNLPWTLDDYDQAKQAFVSFQMIGQQRWLYQTTPDEGTKASGGRHSPHHINSKPPAVAWVSAALYQITRSWDFAWRFPSFVAALALAVLVFRGARTFGDLPALCGAGGIWSEFVERAIGDAGANGYAARACYFCGRIIDV